MVINAYVFFFSLDPFLLIYIWLENHPLSSFLQYSLIIILFLCYISFLILAITHFLSLILLNRLLRGSSILLVFLKIHILIYLCHFLHESLSSLISFLVISSFFFSVRTLFLFCHYVSVHFHFTWKKKSHILVHPPHFSCIFNDTLYF